MWFQSPLATLTFHLANPRDIKALVGYQPQPLTLWLLACILTGWLEAWRLSWQTFLQGLMNGLWQHTAVFWRPARAVPHLKRGHCLSQLARARCFWRPFHCWCFYTQEGSLFALGIPTPSSSLPAVRAWWQKTVPSSALRRFALLVHSSEDFSLPVFRGSSLCFRDLGLNLTVTSRWQEGLWREHRHIFQQDAHFLVPQRV